MGEFDRYRDQDYRERQRERHHRAERGEDREGGIFSGFGRGDRDRDERERERRERGGSRSSASERRSRYGHDWDRDERYYGYDDYHSGLPIEETGRLIASNKVEGTSVYGRDDERLGTIYNFMVDKFSGQVEYAVMSYGGFLGLGQRYYPLPWRILTYDTREGGYRIAMTERDMERAPSFSREDEPRFDREYGRRVNNWYGLDF